MPQKEQNCIMRAGEWLMSGDTLITVLSFTGKFNARGSAYLNCICACGKKMIVAETRIKSGTTRSCGCLNKTKTYRVWVNAKHRCLCPTHRVYKDYGGRGIRMDRRWASSFWEFLRDMGWAPKGLTLDRIDNDGSYKPGNCRWATRGEQGRNRRTCKLTDELVQGIRSMKSVNQHRLAKELDVNQSTISRILSGKRWESAGV